MHEAKNSNYPKENDEAKCPCLPDSKHKGGDGKPARGVHQHVGDNAANGGCGVVDEDQVGWHGKDNEVKSRKGNKK